MRALLYLRLCQIKGGLLSLVRNPGRLIVTLIFVAWMVLWGFFMAAAGVANRSMNRELLTLPEAPLRLGILIGLALVTVGAVERGIQGAVFSFSASDYEFLFPTPISRRLVVAGRLLSDAAGTAFITGMFILIFTVFMPVRLLPGAMSLHGFLRLWLGGALYAGAVVNLARVVELVLEGGGALLSHSRGLLRGVMWFLFLGLLGLVGWLVSLGPAAAAVVMDALDRPPLNALFLAPLTVTALATGDASRLPCPLGAGVALLALLAVGLAAAVCFLDKDLVEATIEHSTRVARLRAARLSQNLEGMAGEAARQRPPKSRSLRVPWRGCDYAFLYAYLAEQLHGGFARRLLWLLVILAPAAGARFIPPEAGDRTVSLLPGPVAAYILLLSASFMSMRFRGEVGHIALLRSLPLRTWRLVLGLMLPRALGLAGGLMLAVGAFWAGRPVAHPGPYVVVLMCLPLATAGVLGVSALTAFLFPLGSDPAQRFLSGLLLMFGTGIVLAPGVLLVVLGSVLRLPAVVTGMLGNLGFVPLVVLATVLAGLALDRVQPGEE